MSYKSRGSEIKEIVLSRIEKLFRLADEAALEHNFARANRYVSLARKIAMKYQYPLPSKYKRRICKHCYSYILPGKTGRIRTRKGYITIYCNHCGKQSHFPFIREIKMRKRKKLNIKPID
jgi:ribonuclease P protein subunit RPR2